MSRLLSMHVCAKRPLPLHLNPSHHLSQHLSHHLWPVPRLPLRATRRPSPWRGPTDGQRRPLLPPQRVLSGMICPPRCRKTRTTCIPGFPPASGALDVACPGATLRTEARARGLPREPALAMLPLNLCLLIHLLHYGKFATLFSEHPACVSASNMKDGWRKGMLVERQLRWEKTSQAAENEVWRKQDHGREHYRSERLRPS